MVSNEKMSHFRQSWPWWRWLITGLSALAFSLSVLLSWHYLAGGSMIGCTGGSPCDQVLTSRWSTIGGVLPVSSLAMGTYLAILVAILFIGPATEASVRRLAWSAILILAGAAAGSAVWFTIVQKWFIGAFCPFCMTTHIIGLILASLVIWRASVGDVFPSAPRRVFGPAVAGLVLAGILAVCQVVFIPPAVYSSGESQDTLTAIDAHSVPLVGSPDALYVVNLLFDYQCTHCQKLHFMLDGAIRHYDGNLAFALCPAPLSSKCNPNIPQDEDDFNHSCELAKIGLAVWLIDREALPAFDLWMFSMESGDRWRPRTLDAAKAKAAELVGQESLENALAHPWIENYIQDIVQTYAHTGNAVPKMVFDSRWVVPQPYDADDLVMILQNGLGVPSP